MLPQATPLLDRLALVDLLLLHHLAQPCPLLQQQALVSLHQQGRLQERCQNPPRPCRHHPLLLHHQVSNPLLRFATHVCQSCVDRWSCCCQPETHDIMLYCTWSEALEPPGHLLFLSCASASGTPALVPINTLDFPVRMRHRQVWDWS